MRGLERLEQRRREAHAAEGQHAERAETEARAHLAQIDVDEANTKRELSDAERHVADAEEATRVAESVLVERRRVVEEQAARATEVKVEATQARERADRERSVLGQLDRSIAELNARLVLPWEIKA